MMPGAATHDLAGGKRDLPLRPESVSCSPGDSRNGHTGTKTSRRSHRPLPLLRQDPAQGHKEPKEQEKQADSFPRRPARGMDPLPAPSHPSFSLVVQGISPGPQSLHKKCLPAKTRSSELELGADKGCAIQTGRACPVSPLTGVRHGASKVRPGGTIHSHDNLVFRSCPSCAHARLQVHNAWNSFLHGPPVTDFLLPAPKENFSLKVPCRCALSFFLFL